MADILKDVLDPNEMSGPPYWPEPDPVLESRKSRIARFVTKQRKRFDLISFDEIAKGVTVGKARRRFWKCLYKSLLDGEFDAMERCRRVLYLSEHSGVAFFLTQELFARIAKANVLGRSMRAEFENVKTTRKLNFLISAYMSMIWVMPRTAQRWCEGEGHKYTLPFRWERYLAARVPVSAPLAAMPPSKSERRRGRPDAYNWTQIEAEVVKLMIHHGEFSPDDPAWDAPAKLKKAILQYCRNTWDCEPGVTQLGRHLSAALDQWRTSPQN